MCAAVKYMTHILNKGDIHSNIECYKSFYEEPMSQSFYYMRRLNVYEVFSIDFQAIFGNQVLLE